MRTPEKVKQEFLTAVADGVNLLEDINLEQMDYNAPELMEQLNTATLHLEKAKFLLAQLKQHKHAA